MLKEQGNWHEAQAVVQETLNIRSLLAAQAPGNARWQQDLASAYSWIGGMLQEQGNLHDAQAAFQENLDISSRLAAQDPSNASWQRDLASAQGNLEEMLHLKSD